MSPSHAYPTIAEGEDPFMKTIEALRNVLKRAAEQNEPSGPRQAQSVSEGDYELELAKLQKELTQERSKFIELEKRLAEKTEELEKTSTSFFETKMELKHVQQQSIEKEQQLVAMRVEIDGIEELNAKLQEQMIASNYEKDKEIDEMRQALALESKEKRVLQEQVDTLQNRDDEVHQDDGQDCGEGDEADRQSRFSQSDGEGVEEEKTPSQIPSERDEVDIAGDAETSETAQEEDEGKGDTASENVGSMAVEVIEDSDEEGSPKKRDRVDESDDVNDCTKRNRIEAPDEAESI